MKIDRKVIIGGFLLAVFCGLGIAALLRSADASAVSPSTRVVYSTTTYNGITCTDITPLQLKERIDDESDNNYIILDVRDEASFDAGHIPGAINIPLGQLGYRMYALDRSKDIIAYCQTGARSRVTCQILTNGGFTDVYNLVGGIKNWEYAIETSDGRVRI